MEPAKHRQMRRCFARGLKGRWLRSTAFVEHSHLFVPPSGTSVEVELIASRAHLIGGGFGKGNSWRFCYKTALRILLLTKPFARIYLACRNFIPTTESFVRTAC